ncbi:hypothetical protein SteCoe_25584 [Stentor coeruleus]|uniref:Tubulin--tyrosine ligase-like protein 5 n=1 Tax=Stentor coeruleus TaxID=5963 RepID=A0A1R2BEY8_9CILI|nr:hypothetical protein SteCoe_25584 [Stentor coeruleus]
MEISQTSEKSSSSSSSKLCKDVSVCQKVKTLQELEKTTWKGLDVDQVGKIGKGLDIQPKLSDPLLKATKESSSEKPPLIVFNPVTECQLVKDPLMFSAFTKGNFNQSKDLLYRVYKTEGKLVRSILELAGFSYTDSHDWNLLWLGCPPQLFFYDGLYEHQKINHFPNSYEITRKDRMSVHLKAMQIKHGIENYNFFPDTYVIPDEYTEFYTKFYSEKATQWIVKPCNSSQGKGIFMLDSLASLPTIDGCVVSKYIHNPLLINDLKFDMRIYVLVTSYDPLKIYIYDEGLARFASEPYSASNRASKFSFLTNYSINKKNDKFVQNQDSHQDNVGHKWSISALFKTLEAFSIDTSLLQSKIYDLIIKTIIAVEPTVTQTAKKLSIGRNNCFDLLGFDVIIDSNLKPWLLEVNLSPSLATEAPIDLHIKSNLIADTLNLVGVRYYDRKKECMNKLRARIRARKNQTRQTENKLKNDKPSMNKKDTISFSKYKLSINDLIDEASRIGHFVRIYPCEGCEIYDKFFNIQRSSNKTLLAFIMSHITIEEEGKDNENPMMEAEVEKKPIEKDRNKLVITGDDILIEYLSRVHHACKSVTLEKMKSEWKLALDKFVNHYIWINISSPITSNLTLSQRLELRIHEMKERRKISEAGSKDFLNFQSQRHMIVRGFSALQLENMLKSSSKSLAKEIMSCLFFDNNGILSEIIKWMASMSIKKTKKPKRVYRQGSMTSEDFEKSKKNKQNSEKYPRSTSFIMKALQARMRYFIYRPKTSHAEPDESDNLE